VRRLCFVFLYFLDCVGACSHTGFRLSKTSQDNLGSNGVLVWVKLCEPNQTIWFRVRLDRIGNKSDWNQALRLRRIDLLGHM
jgi:hypothetical protein